MKMKITILPIMSIFIIFALLLYSVPISADKSSYIKMNTPFTVDPNQQGYALEPGTTIHQLANGETQVYGPDAKLKFKARDSESRVISRPNGQEVKANHIYLIPSDCQVIRKGDITYISKNNKNILTLIIDKKSKSYFPPFDGYIEQAYDWSVVNLTYFTGNWNAPTRPSDWQGSQYYYLWNGIHSTSGQGLMQPVLEWNYGSTHAWTGAAWYVVSDSDWLRATPVSVSVGQQCRGTMTYTQGTDSWLITFRNVSAGTTSDIVVIGFSYQNVAVIVAMEGYEVFNDADVGGDCTFSNLSGTYLGNPVLFNWTELVNSSVPLTGLRVDGAYYGSSTIVLNTAN